VSILAELIGLRRGRVTSDDADGAPARARSMRHTPRTLAPGR